MSCFAFSLAAGSWPSGRIRMCRTRRRSATFISFGWASFDCDLEAGSAKLDVVIDKAGEAWRQVDALLLTDDLKYEPVGREKPPFAYLASFDLAPKAADWSPDLAPNQWGFVAPRYENHAVAAQLDGHVESFGLREMQDMRHWCNTADRADFILQTTP